MINEIEDSNFISGFSTYSMYLCKKGQTLIPNLQESCKSYYACTKNSVQKYHYVKLSCPTSLLFNKHNNQCDYPENVVCV